MSKKRRKLDPIESPPCSLGAQCGRPMGAAARWLCCLRCPSFYHATCCAHLDAMAMGDYKEPDDVIDQLFACGKCFKEYKQEYTLRRDDFAQDLETVMLTRADFKGVTLAKEAFDDPSDHMRYHYGYGEDVPAHPVTFLELKERLIEYVSFLGVAKDLEAMTSEMLRLLRPDLLPQVKEIKAEVYEAMNKYSPINESAITTSDPVAEPIIVTDQASTNTHQQPTQVLHCEVCSVPIIPPYFACKVGHPVCATCKKSKNNNYASCVSCRARKMTHFKELPGVVRVISQPPKPRPNKSSIDPSIRDGVSVRQKETLSQIKNSSKSETFTLDCGCDVSDKKILVVNFCSKGCSICNNCAPNRRNKMQCPHSHLGCWWKKGDNFLLKRSFKNLVEFAREINVVQKKLTADFLAQNADQETTNVPSSSKKSSASAGLRKIRKISATTVVLPTQNPNTSENSNNVPTTTSIVTVPQNPPVTVGQIPLAMPETIPSNFDSKKMKTLQESVLRHQEIVLNNQRIALNQSNLRQASGVFQSNIRDFAARQQLVTPQIQQNVTVEQPSFAQFVQETIQRQPSNDQQYQKALPQHQEQQPNMTLDRPGFAQFVQETIQRQPSNDHQYQNGLLQYPQQQQHLQQPQMLSHQQHQPQQMLQAPIDPSVIQSQMVFQGNQGFNPNKALLHTIPLPQEHQFTVLPNAKRGRPKKNPENAKQPLQIPQSSKESTINKPPQLSQEPRKDSVPETQRNIYQPPPRLEPQVTPSQCYIPQNEPIEVEEQAQDNGVQPGFEDMEEVIAYSKRYNNFQPTGYGRRNINVQPTVVQPIKVHEKRLPAKNYKDNTNRISELEPARIIKVKGKKSDKKYKNKRKIDPQPEILTLDSSDESLEDEAIEAIRIQDRQPNAKKRKESQSVGLIKSVIASDPSTSNVVIDTQFPSTEGDANKSEEPITTSTIDLIPCSSQDNSTEDEDDFFDVDDVETVEFKSESIIAS